MTQPGDAFSAEHQRVFAARMAAVRGLATALWRADLDPDNITRSHARWLARVTPLVYRFLRLEKLLQERYAVVDVADRHGRGHRLPPLPGWAPPRVPLPDWDDRDGVAEGRDRLEPRDPEGEDRADIEAVRDRLRSLGAETLKKINRGVDPETAVEEGARLAGSNASTAVQRAGQLAYDDSIRDLSIRTTSTRPVLGWARITRPDCCSYCSMQAGRGAVFSKAGGQFAAHRNCRCVGRAVLLGDPVVEQVWRLRRLPGGVLSTSQWEPAGRARIVIAVPGQVTPRQRQRA